ncbi:MAG TPA: hypothetical protein VFD44_06900 [Hanamia sp.]|nr:hypothetical protein [Hanamia sp.]
MVQVTLWHRSGDLRQSQYQQALKEYLKNKKSIEYFETSALANANLILRQAQLAFQSGDIGYV